MIVVLAGSFAETAKFSKQQGLRHTPHITNRDKLAGLRPTKIHLLPGFFSRRDFHSVNAELTRIKRNRPAPEIVEWDKVGGEFLRPGQAEPTEAETYGVEIPAQKNALGSDVTQVMDAERNGGSLDPAVNGEPSRLDTLEALAELADVDDTDDSDEFFSMLDEADSNG